MPYQPLSVVIPSIRGWPFAKLALDPLREQAPRTDAEMIFLDSSGRPPPSEAEVGFPVRPPLPVGPPPGLPDAAHLSHRDW